MSKSWPFIHLKRRNHNIAGTPRADDQELEGLARMEYYHRITKFACDTTRHLVGDSTTVIDFRPLYAVTIHHLQRQLAQEMQVFFKSDMDDAELEKITKLLKNYSNPPC